MHQCIDILPESSYIDRELRTGVDEALSYFRMTLTEGVGPKLSWALRLGPRYFDTWAILVTGNYV